MRILKAQICHKSTSKNANKLDYVVPRLSRSSSFHWVHFCESYPGGYHWTVLIRWLGSLVSNVLYCRSSTLKGLGRSCRVTLGAALVCLHVRCLLWTTLLTLDLVLQLFRAWLQYCLFRVTLETTARADAGEDIEEIQAFVETYLLTFSFLVLRGAGHVLAFFLGDAVFVSDEIVCACESFLCSDHARERYTVSVLVPGQAVQAHTHSHSHTLKVDSATIKLFVWIMLQDCPLNA